MSKCQVIPLHGRVRMKHVDANITSFSAMLADGVTGTLPEQRHARIYDFQTRVANGVQGESGPKSMSFSMQPGIPQPEQE